MREFILEKELDFVKLKNIAKFYLSDELPEIKLIASAYALILKDGKLLHADLNEKERGERRYDIPGGHLDIDENPQDGAIRETLEETGVKIKNVKLFAYFEIEILEPMPTDYWYPYPTGYMCFFTGDIKEELPFEGNEESHGRAWLDIKDSPWCMKYKELISALINKA